MFANISINPEAGTIVALNEDIVGTLVDICRMQRAGDSTPAAIILPTLATLNNLSFYPLVHQVETYQALKKFLHMPESVAVCAETARVFGNLSRRPEIRQCFLQEGKTFVLPCMSYCFSQKIAPRPRLVIRIFKIAYFLKLVQFLGLF